MTTSYKSTKTTRAIWSRSGKFSDGTFKTSSTTPASPDFNTSASTAQPYAFDGYTADANDFEDDSEIFRQYERYVINSRVTGVLPVEMSRWLEERATDPIFSTSSICSTEVIEDSEALVDIRPVRHREAA